MTQIILTSLENAYSSFKIAFEAHQKKPKDLLLRDATIQRFEYTYELAVKLLKRQLDQLSHNPSEIDKMGYRDQIRVAAQKGLISNPEIWFIFREMRNRTSHTYDESQANKIAEIFPDFATIIFELLVKLQKLNDY